jgi:hypothetical protein
LAHSFETSAHIGLLALGPWGDRQHGDRSMWRRRLSASWQAGRIHRRAVREIIPKDMLLMACFLQLSSVSCLFLPEMPPCRESFKGSLHSSVRAPGCSHLWKCSQTHLAECFTNLDVSQSNQLGNDN